MGLIIISQQKGNITVRGNYPEFVAGKLLPGALTWAIPGASLRPGGPVWPPPRALAPSPSTLQLAQPLSFAFHFVQTDKGREIMRVPAPQSR